MESVGFVLVRTDICSVLLKHLALNICKKKKIVKFILILLLKINTASDCFSFFIAQVHRSLMTITLLLTIAATILIFVHVKGWSSVSLLLRLQIHEVMISYDITLIFFLNT